MSFENWFQVTNEEQSRAWSSNEYIFRVGKQQREAEHLFRELQSATPLKMLIEKAAEDEIIRSLTFLSYYLVNPTFAPEENDLGANFFWFPLDELTDDRYALLVGDFNEDDEENQEEENEPDLSEAAPLKSYPVASLVGEPMIEAAISDSYITGSRRKSEEERKEILEERVREKREEELEEIEDWLSEGYQDETFLDSFSTFAEAMGRMPSLFLRAAIEGEKERIEEIHEVFSRTKVDLSSYPQTGPGLLLSRLTTLTETHPALENFAIECFCLDENDRQCDYHVTKYHGYELDESTTECEHCGSDLYRIFRAGFEDSVRDAWMMGLLPELVIANTLEKCDWVEEVIPHKLVQMKTEEGLTSSVEVDVAVHTGDDKVLFFEVTSQRDDALSRVNKKIRNYDNAGIEYDGIVQISLAENRQMVPFTENAVSASPWMIPSIETPEFESDLRQNLSNLEG